MKNRPVRGDSETDKIQIVNKVLKDKKIEYLKEEFYKSKISEGSEFIYGYKHFLNSDPHKGFDKGFYETLIGDLSLIHI